MYYSLECLVSDFFEIRKMDEEDLFAVFDSDSAKEQQIVIPDDEDNKNRDDEKPVKFDTGNLVAEICGGNVKRAASEDMDTSDTKKVKTESGMTLMTGLTDEQVKEKMEADSREVDDDATSTDEKVDEEEDQAVISLVEAAPRFVLHNHQLSDVYFIGLRSIPWTLLHPALTRLQFLLIVSLQDSENL